MNARINRSPNKEKGAVLIFTAFALVLLVAMAGLAIDISHAYVNKTRLQNLADALALSAAISLAKQEKSGSITDVETFAEDYARNNTFPAFTGSSGNGEIASGISGAELAFTFSKFNPATGKDDLDDLDEESDWKSADAIDNAIFARVVVSPMSISTWFMNVLGIWLPGNFSHMTVAATAVAGSAPIVPCDVAPIMMCAEVDAAGEVIDDNCGDDTNPIPGVTDSNDCYGYELNALYCMKQQEGTWANDPLCPQPPTGSFGPGNFAFLDYDPPGLNPSLKYCAAGDPDCALNCKFPEDPITGLPVVSTKTGQNFGTASQGFNTRFNLYGGGLSSDQYPPDLVIGSGTNGNLDKVQVIGSETELSPEIYNNYKNAAPDTPSGEKNRRAIGIPFVDCREDMNGKENVKILGYGCFLMAREFGNSSNPYVYNDIDANKKFMYGVFLGEDDACLGTGDSNSKLDFGFFEVILYKDPLGGHS